MHTSCWTPDADCVDVPDADCVDAMQMKLRSANCMDMKPRQSRLSSSRSVMNGLVPGLKQQPSKVASLPGATRST